MDFSELAERYPVIFFDAFGVLKNASGILPGTAAVLERLRAQGKDLYIVTNDASRSPEHMAKTYVHGEHGALVPAGKILSSGLLASEYLAETVREGPVAYLGTEASAFFIEHAGLRALPVSECREQDAPKALVVLDDEGFDWPLALNRSLNLLRESDIPVVVANADLAYPVRGNEVALAAGSLGRMLEAALGRDLLFFGKPEPRMFSYVFDQAAAQHPGLQRGDVLMVGDTLQTDILGAERFGLDTALVLSGNTPPARAEQMIEASGIRPTHLCPSILS
ncbi:MAG: HAD-IIA family hydrolase [Myxococcales bacterium]|nr:HAD-IIA family hydrolase [Myxococcales bacterium]